MCACSDNKPPQYHRVTSTNWSYIYLCVILMAAASVVGHLPPPNSRKNILKGHQIRPANYRRTFTTEDYQRSGQAQLSTPLEHAEAPFVIPNTQDSDGETFDFIVIGSGSAGSVIANRLSEIRSWRILLLEAGNPENVLVQYPGLQPLLLLTEYNWGYTTEPQTRACRAMIQQRCHWPRGRGLGGSTLINTLIYSRGHPKDYDRWAAQGNPGWSYADVFPYFLKSEDARLNYSNPHFHHQGGYLSVQHSYASQLSKSFVQAGYELGHTSIDYNSREQIGFFDIQANTKQGRRQTAASAFLAPILHRRNLRILTGAQVTKILIDPVTNTAYGVEYSRADKAYSVRANKEVIVSAGAIGSPQLLMLSGVGPKQHLEEHGIKTIRNLPVGKTLYDHVNYAGLVLDLNHTITYVDVFSPSQLSIWQTKGQGPLAAAGPVQALAYINTGISFENKDIPDIELILTPTASLGTELGESVTRRILRVDEGYYNRMFSNLTLMPSFTILITLLHPKSKGHLKLRSTNPYDYPLIHANYLTDAANSDAKTLLAGIRYALRILETPPLQSHNARLNPTPVVGCEALPFNSDEYWYCALQYFTTTLHHQSSTCKMGPDEDPYAVVNNELKVYGIRNLRVADASVIPFPLSGHISAPIFMIGEMVSDLIKGDWGVLPKLERKFGPYQNQVRRKGA